VLPLLVWIPVLVSAVLLGTGWIVRWTVGEGSPWTLGALTAWFVVAAWLQLGARSPTLVTVGLVLQAMLAVILVVRAKIRAV